MEGASRLFYGQVGALWQFLASGLRAEEMWFLSAKSLPLRRVTSYYGANLPLQSVSLACRLFLFFLFLLFRAIPTVYRSSQTRGWIRAVATGLCHSHSNTRSKLCLWPIPQLMAMLDPQPTEWGQGSNLHPHRYQSDLFLLSHDKNSSAQIFIRALFSIAKACKQLQCPLTEEWIKKR